MAADSGAAAPAAERPIRAAEVVGALSLATDLGTGQPLEHALRTAVLAVRLGELAGASARELADTYYIALLHASGCTSNGHEATLLYGDDIAHRAAFYLIDTTDPAQVLEFYRAHVGAGQPPDVSAALIDHATATPGPGRVPLRDDVRGRSAVRRAGSSSARASGTRSSTCSPAGTDAASRALAGDAIPLPMRLLHVARDISLFLSAAGPEEARGVLERRSGAAYEPRLAAIALRTSTSSSAGSTRRGCGTRRSRSSRSRRSGWR